MTEGNIKKCFVCEKSFYIGDPIWDLGLSLSFRDRNIDTTGKYIIMENGDLICGKCYDDKFGLDVEDRWPDL